MICLLLLTENDATITTTDETNAMTTDETVAVAIKHGGVAEENDTVK